MPDNEFDQRLQEVDRNYALHREGAEACRDQEISRLFVECGWTQVRIAQRMGRTQKWVSNRLRFGAFLKFRTAGSNSSSPPHVLSEWGDLRLGCLSGSCLDGHYDSSRVVKIPPRPLMCSLSGVSAMRGGPVVKDIPRRPRKTASHGC